MRSASTVRAVALFEAAKGVLVFLVGFGALSFIHHDVQHAAEQVVAHFHLNPAAHTPRIFLSDAAKLNDARLGWLAFFAAVYGTVRLVEAYGLWYEKRWAEWFAAASGSLYIPFELYELYKAVTWLSIAALCVNVLVVGLMIRALRPARSAPA